MTALAAPRLLRPDGLPFDLDPDIDAPLVGPSVLAFVGTAALACNMWRIWQPFASLQLRGYRAEWAWMHVDRSADAMPFFDAYVMCRSLWTRDQRPGAERWARRLRKQGKRLFFETDDDLFSEFMVDQQASGIQQGRSREELRREAEDQTWSMALCDGVTVSTQRLATVVRQHTSKPVEVVPNAIDAEWWAGVQKLAPRTLPGPVIGWTGGHRPDADLAPMLDAWARIAARRPEVRFLMGGFQSLHPGVPEARLTRLPWRHQSEHPMSLVDIDIGCCPLEDKPFNRAKSPIKAYEYALSGAAVVASPTVYRQCVDDGRTGLLATTTDEWEAALEALLADEARRRAVAAALKADVLAKWSLRRNFWRWPAAWDRLWRG